MNADLLLLGGAMLSGLAGSGHCALMCGGIATSFNARSGSGWLAAVEPNLGRVLGYALAGAAAGGIGHGIVELARMQSLERGLRAAAGLVLVIAALRLYDRTSRLRLLQAPGSLWRRALAPLQQRLPRGGGTGSRLLAGMLWGWLPCGLSSTVLLAAWLQAGAMDGALLMLCFGLGTMPAMVPLTFCGARLGQRLQRGAARTAVATLVLSAGMLTLLAPWLARVPALHATLRALGCASSG